MPTEAGTRTINHGEQFLREPYRRQPVTYSAAIRHRPGHAGRKKAAAAYRKSWFGCGTLALRAAGDTLRIYEINPLVLDIARSESPTFATRPRESEVPGDGPPVLEAEPSQQSIFW